MSQQRAPTPSFDPPVPDALGPPDAFSSAPAVVTTLPPEYACLFPRPPSSTSSDSLSEPGPPFCYLCAHPFTIPSNVWAQRCERMWTQSILHMRLEDVARAVATFYRLHIQPHDPSKRPWPVEMISQHFVSHCIHMPTRRVMQTRMSVSLEQQMLQTLEQRDASGALVPPSDRTMLTFERLIKTQRLVLEALDKK